MYYNRRLTLTVAFSNRSRIFSSESPDTPDTISVAANFSKGKSNSCKDRYMANWYMNVQWENKSTACEY